MRYVALSINPARVQRMRRLYPTVEVFPGVPCAHKNYRLYCIPPAYHNLAVWGKEQQLDRGTIVMQDDVWLPHGPGFDAWQAEYETPLLIFGTTEANGIVVPKAFAADPEIWDVLPEYWTGEGRVGPAWMPLVERFGLVLDVARGLGG